MVAEHLISLLRETIVAALTLALCAIIEVREKVGFAPTACTSRLLTRGSLILTDVRR